MITKTLKTTAGKLKISVPTSLSEITLGQMIDLQEAVQLSDLTAISILSGIPVVDLNQVIDTADLLSFGSHILALAGQITDLYNSDAIPKEIAFNIDDKTVTVKITQNLGIEPAGAFMAAREIIAGEIAAHIKQYGEANWQESFNPSLQACAKVLGHYFFCPATGKPYNEYRAEEFSTEIKKLRVTEALPVAKHFFTCYPNLSKTRTGCFLRLRRRLKKGLAYKPSKNLNTSTPSTPSPAATSPNGI